MHLLLLVTDQRYFMINGRARIKLMTSGSAVWLATNCPIIWGPVQTIWHPNSILIRFLLLNFFWFKRNLPQKLCEITKYAKSTTKKCKEYSKCSKILSTSCLLKGIVKQCRPRSDCFFRSSLIQVFPVCYLTSNLWVPALKTSIIFEDRRRKMFKILEHLPYLDKQ